MDVELRLRLLSVPSDLDRFVAQVNDEIDSSAIVSSFDGIVYAVLSRGADSSASGILAVAFDLAHDVEKLGAIVDDIDDELVDLTEIAERVERSRETVRLWALGKRGRGDFPLPSGALPGSVKIWEWEAVNTWLLLHHPSLADDVVHLSRVDRARFRIQREADRLNQRSAAA